MIKKWLERDIFGIKSVVLFYFVVFAMIPISVFADGKVTIAVLANGGEVNDAIVRSIRSNLAPADISVVIFEKNALADSAKISVGLKAGSPSVIVAVGTSMAKAAQKAVTDIPVIFTMVLGSDRSGVMPSGVAMDIPYSVKLKEVASMFSHKDRIGVLYSPGAVSELGRVQDACILAGCTVIPIEVETENDFPSAVDSAVDKVDMILMIADPKVYFPKAVEYLLSESLSHKVPVIGLSSVYTKAGALVAFDCDYKDLGRQTADMVRDVLGGQRSAKVVAPEKVVYSFNVKVAEHIGVNISDEWLEKADKVFGR